MISEKIYTPALYLSELWDMLWLLDRLDSCLLFSLSDFPSVLKHE